MSISILIGTSCAKAANDRCWSESLVAVRVPFLYSTNGEVIWYHDVRHELSRSREIAKFHTPDALTEFLARDLEAPGQTPGNAQ